MQIPTLCNPDPARPDMTNAFRTNGTEASNSIVTDGTLQGALANDIISGLGCNDLIQDPTNGSGSAGNDRIFGDRGNDTIKGGLGADTLDGGAEFDTVDYNTSTAPVNVDLNRTGAQSGGFAAGDVLRDIAAVAGSRLADSMTGNSANNALRGGSGVGHGVFRPIRPTPPLQPAWRGRPRCWGSCCRGRVSRWQARRLWSGDHAGRRFADRGTGAQMRAVPVAVRVGGQIRPGLAAELLRRAGRAMPVLSGDTLRQGAGQFALMAPGRVRVRPSDPAQVAARTVTAADVPAGRVPPDRIAGALVLVGSSRPERGGLRPTAAGPPTPSVQIWADAVAGLAARRLPTRPACVPILEAVALALGGGVLAALTLV